MADKDYKKLFDEKSKRATALQEPHYYGRVGKVHVFHATHENHKEMLGNHVHSPDDNEIKRQLEDVESKGGHSVIIHGDPPPSLRQKAKQGIHPHSYDWHDGHTDHHDIEKLEKFIVPEHHGDEQSAYDGSKTHKPIAEKFGKKEKDKKTNLQFYRGIEQAEPAIDKMIKDHGYKFYMAGGEHGKPDLRNKNYNTRHLTIWNQKSKEGKDFGDEEHSRSWRKLHELSHALTYPEVNNMYGEGRRIEKLGKRTPNEAKRSVHWEWLAAHKQRDLSKQLGFKIKKEDFHRELNTVMNDAVHRAIVGKFVEPSERGFQPSSEKVDLEQSLKMIDDHAKAMGLDHSHATLEGTPNAMARDYPEVKKNLKKAFTQEDGETLTDPRAHQPAIGAVPKALIEWGREHLVSMKRDGIRVLNLDGKTIKVRKVLEDLYSGWIESEGRKIHQFEKLALPELLSQIQSKLELYGREEEVVAKEKIIEVPSKEMIDEHEEYKEKVGTPTGGESSVVDLSEEEKAYAAKVADVEEIAEAAELGDISDKLKNLQNRISNLKEHELSEVEVKEVVERKEISEGMLSPEKDCPACERAVEECVCYIGLPNPRVEFDGKKVTIFFKSQWNENDRDNFRTDLIKRAGKILIKRKAEQARNILKNIKDE